MISALLLSGLASLTPHDSDHRFLPNYDSMAIARAQGEVPTSLVVEADPKEKHFAKLTQMTFGGQNAEAYWSLDGKSITYQSLQPGYPDEQIFTMNADGTNRRLISTGLGRCTCSYITPKEDYVYFSSTHEVNPGAQKKLDRSKGYVWMVNPDFSVYRASLKSPAKGLEKIVSYPGAYAAETTIAPNGKYITWTSDFEGDLEIYRSDLNGKNVKRLTNDPGYDGGPFVSWDSKKIAYRRDSLSGPEKLAEYKELLKEHLVRPGKLEIWVMDADGRNKKQLTKLGGASFAPFIHPDGKRVIFSSNWEDPKGREFDLYMVNLDGTGIERITYTGDFDGFPMFTRDGKKLIFASNRYGKVRGETNLFIADWKD